MATFFFTVSYLSNDLMFYTQNGRRITNHVIFYLKLVLYFGGQNFSALYSKTALIYSNLNLSFVQLSNLFIYTKNLVFCCHSTCHETNGFYFQGRTGVMICSYLLYKGIYTDPKEAMHHYAKARTENEKVC